MNAQTIVEQSQPFLSWLVDWHAQLPSAQLEAIVDVPDRAAILAVDVTNGFCHFGPLASPRVKGIIDPIVRLLQAAHAYGMHHFVMTHDAHDPAAVEFGDYPAHCVRGSDESEPVPELKALPFWKDVSLMPKNSIDSALGTRLDRWLDDHPQVKTYIVVGDCTDLCIYQLAMHVRLKANERQQAAVRVIVPEDCVNTYDLPIEAAQQAGALPHDGDLLHLIFLYHLALNGAEIVRTLSMTVAQPRPTEATVSSRERT
jgi:nicotinamidase-related amidase